MFIEYLFDQYTKYFIFYCNFNIKYKLFLNYKFEKIKSLKLVKIIRLIFNNNFNQIINNDNLKYLRKCSRISLKSCNNSFINEELKYLTSCKKLSLSNSSCITGNGLKYIPKLNWVYLCNNKNFNNFQYMNNLERIEIYSNKFIRDNNFKYFVNCKILCLGNCLRVTGSEFRCLNKCKKIVLYGHHLRIKNEYLNGFDKICFVRNQFMFMELNELDRCLDRCMKIELIKCSITLEDIKKLKNYQKFNLIN